VNKRVAEVNFHLIKLKIKKSSLKCSAPEIVLGKEAAAFACVVALALVTQRLMNGGDCEGNSHDFVAAPLPLFRRNENPPTNIRTGTI
jgi:hypothetical protein